MLRKTIPVLLLATTLDTLAAFMAQSIAYMGYGSSGRYIFPLQIAVTVVLAAWVLSAILTQLSGALPRKQALLRRGLPLAAGMGAVALLGSLLSLSNILMPGGPSAPALFLFGLYAKAVFTLLTWLALTGLNRQLWRQPTMHRPLRTAAALSGVVLVWTALSAPLAAVSFSMACSENAADLGSIPLLYALQQVCNLPAIYAIGLLWAAPSKAGR